MAPGPRDGSNLTVTSREDPNLASSSMNIEIGLLKSGLNFETPTPAVALNTASTSTDQKLQVIQTWKETREINVCPVKPLS